jgi:N-acyl homoserine lactone hydrolase
MSLANSILNGEIQRLYVLDFGLFQVHDDGRRIGIPGYLIQTREGRNILVDTGFPARYVSDGEQAAVDDNLGSFGRVVKLGEANSPIAQLALIGLDKDSIDTLVLTHSDIDHVGAIGEFPGVPIVVGAAERALNHPRYFGERSPISWPSGVEYQRINEDTALCPGVALLYTPGHSPGHLSLMVRLPQTGVVLLTADAIARPAEMEQGFGGAWDEEKARKSANRLMSLAMHERAMIIFGHDPAQWPRLPKAPDYFS